MQSNAEPLDQKRSTNSKQRKYSPKPQGSQAKRTSELSRSTATKLGSKSEIAGDMLKIKSPLNNQSTVKEVEIMQ